MQLQINRPQGFGNSRVVNWASVLALSVGAAVGAAGLALSTGCSNMPSRLAGNPGRWAQPQAATTPVDAPASNSAAPVQVSTGVQPSHAPQVASAPVEPGRVYTRRAFDPLWIESASSAERRRPGANWTPYNTSLVSYSGTPVRAASSDPHHSSSNVQLRTGGLSPDGAAAANSGWVDDAPEGLAHVTFAPEGADFDPCISRDAQFMVFASTQHRATSDIYFKKVDGRTITQLTADPAQDVMPAISPDGKKIAFCSNRRGNWDVFVMSVSGGQAVQVTSELSHELHPTWSPDGKKLAFSRLGETSGRWEIWVTDAVGASGNEFLGYGLFPEWCPVAGTGENGRDKILFQRSRERGDRAFSVWTVDYKTGDTSSPTEIVADTTAAVINASWSPDGQSIVYATVANPNQPRMAGTGAGSGQFAGAGAASQLWITGIDGTGRVALTSDQHLNLMPIWATDGRIYFVSDRSGTNNVWSLGTEKAMYAAKGQPMPGQGNAARAGAPADGQSDPAGVTGEGEDSASASVPTDEGGAQGGQGE